MRKSIATWTISMRKSGAFRHSMDIHFVPRPEKKEMHTTSLFEIYWTIYETEVNQLMLRVTHITQAAISSTLAVIISNEPINIRIRMKMHRTSPKPNDQHKLYANDISNGRFIEFLSIDHTNHSKTQQQTFDKNNALPIVNVHTFLASTVNNTVHTMDYINMLISCKFQYFTD